MDERREGKCEGMLRDFSVCAFPFFFRTMIPPYPFRERNPNIQFNTLRASWQGNAGITLWAKLVFKGTKVGKRERREEGSKGGKKKRK